MRNFLMLTASSVLLTLSLNVSSSEDHHDHENTKVIGKNKAVTDFDKEKGFKLSKEAVQTLGIKAKTLKGDIFPESALVIEKDKKGFYILRAGYFKYLDISQFKNLKPDDQIVFEGLGILKITEVYLSDESEYGHSH